jgi:ubiquinone/menaquinone biosynthesis C-methylase UbiE
MNQNVSRPRVDYDVVAERYQRGRHLSTAALNAWRDAVRPFLPRHDPVVLDVGAGTGIFARAWPTWGARKVLAVEPAPAMRGQTVAAGVPDGVSVIAGVAEALPLRDSTVDVAWLSAVVHHLTDLDRAAAELHRVLTVGGSVIVRGMFADRGDPGWLRWAPGADRVRGVFPSTSRIAEVFGRHGLHAATTVDITERDDATGSEAAAWLRTMRNADTLLKAFTDAELADAAAVLAGIGSAPIDPTKLAMVVLLRPS